MKKLDVINTWAFHGIQYLFLADFIDKYYFATIRAFVLVQGLELILKAYILAKKENEYLSIESESEAKEKIDKIAKKYNHKFNKMIKDIDNNELEKVYKNHSINGIKTSTLLKRIIQESRYPVPERLSVFKEFPVNKSKELKSYFKNADDNSYVDIYFQPSLTGFFYELCYLTLKYLESEHDLNINDLKNIVMPYDCEFGNKFKHFWKMFYEIRTKS